MEPDVMPLHVSAAAPVYDHGGESLSEEDEFGEFGGFTEPSPPRLRQPPPAAKPAARGPSWSCNHQAEPSRPATGAEQMAGSSHFTNGYAERDPASPREQTGFADFTVFSEQAAHPWCCGFSPAGDGEQWGGGAGAAIRSDPDPERETIMESEPRPHRASAGDKRGCATVKHCAESVAALVHSSQDHHHHSQGAAPRPGEGGRHWRGSSDSFKALELQNSMEADEDDAERTVEFEDSASLFDNVSFGGPSEDFEPNVSSLGSPGDQTDAEDDELGDDGLSDSSAADRHFHPSAPQETSATSFADFHDGASERHRNIDGAQAVDGGQRILGGLPPSDSFADFCSAPAQEDGGEAWAEFREQRVEEEEEEEEEGEEEEEPSSLQTEEGEHGASRRRSSQASLCCRVQQLLQTTFPESGVSPVEGEEMVLDLAALLHTKEEEEEETPPLCPRAQWVQQGFWWPHQDAHSALSLKFQWGGSHTNRILLSCLGVDTRNIVFMGTKKQPLSVPVFASSLGMLEPTKDSAPVVGSPGRAALGAAPGSAGAQGPSADSLQEPLSSGRRDGSSRRLSSSQDDCSVLDLDYFGPEEASGSSSSSSRSNTPPPGVDRELYELTLSKVDAGFDSGRLEETWNRLMSTAERTSTSVRKPQRDAELSAEADMLISGLPNLSFMQARVLMFPSVLLPR